MLGTPPFGEGLLIRGVCLLVASSRKLVEVRIIRAHDVDFAAENETNESNHDASAAESAGQAEDNLTPLVSNNSGTP